MNDDRAKGFSYVEVLITIMTLPILFVIMDKMFRELTVDLPKSTEVVSQHERLLRCIESVEQDLEQAVSVPEAAGAWQQDANTLLIQLSDIVVAYVQNETGVARLIVEPEDPEAKRVWPMSDARITWTCLRGESEPSRVEVSTGVLHQRRKKQQLKNTRLFYVGSARMQGGAL